MIVGGDVRPEESKALPPIGRGAFCRLLLGESPLPRVHTGAFFILESDYDYSSIRAK